MVDQKRRRRLLMMHSGSGPDLTAPTLSSATDNEAGTTSVTISVSSNEASGTLYWVLTTTSTPPTAAQVKLGQDYLGASATASGNQAVVATGAQSISTITGLTTNTTYYAYFMQEDAAHNQSSVAAGNGAIPTLLYGETDGMASDFTVSSGAGDVYVLDTGTPGNNVSHVIGDAWWGNAGTSPKLVRNSSGTLQWSPHNQILQSEAFGTTWTTAGSAAVAITSNTTAAPDGSLTADTIGENATSNSTYILKQNSMNVIAGATYIFTVYLKPAGRDWALIEFGDNFGSAYAWFDVANGAVGSTPVGTPVPTITAAGNGWYKCTVTKVSANTGTNGSVSIWTTTADNVTTHVGVVGSGVYAWGAQLNHGAVPTTYLATTAAARFGLGIDYDGTSYGLLVEPAATNLLLNSLDMNGASWSIKTDITVTVDNTTAPDGTATADLTTEGSAGTAIEYQGITITANTTYTTSFFCKKGNTDWVRIIMFETAATTNRTTAWFNLNTGAVGTVSNGGTGSGAASSITALGNGWYRCVFSGAINNSATAVSVGINSASADNSGTRVSGATYYLWGAQLELGTIATSPIPTFAATVTRALDKVTAATTTFPLGSATTLIAHTVDTVASNGAGLISINDNSAANRADIRTQHDGSSTSSFITASSSAQAALVAANGAAASDGSTLSKWALAVAANDFSLVVNGLTAVTDVSGTAPQGSITQIMLGNVDQGTSSITVYKNGHIRKVISLPRRMTNGDMQTATT